MHSGSTNRLRRGWPGESQLFASVETLLHYLGNNWEADEKIVVDWLAQEGGQYCKVYFFLLRHDKKITQMAVLENANLPRIIAEYHLTTVAPIGEPENLKFGAGEGFSAPASRHKPS